MIDNIRNNYDPGAKPIWPEKAYPNTPDLTGCYVDRHNRDSYWTKAFYALGGWNTLCSGTDTLICSNNGGISYQITPFGTAYRQVYAGLRESLSQFSHNIPALFFCHLESNSTVGSPAKITRIRRKPR